MLQDFMLAISARETEENHYIFISWMILGHFIHITIIFGQKR